MDDWLCLPDDEEEEEEVTVKVVKQVEDLPNIQYPQWFNQPCTVKVTGQEEMGTDKNRCDYLYFQKKFPEALASYRNFQERWQKKLKGKDKYDDRKRGKRMT
eukprot:TRINITY_DN3665_c0_g2_i3.p2 TRINITY_DN3665_c0_g2~~TRINITY_DN3665_c0_g2_i3.p2  ORF type:complete len:102 (+),score=27.08 TRINITY_DN3665_c0_g2_i3:3-308(+)